MAQLKLVTRPFHAFPYRKWNPVLRTLCDEYRANSPSPHIYLADFLEDDTACMIARDFPSPAAPGWTYYKHQNENKLGMTQRSMFPGVLGKVVDELNSPEFVEWISDLTGISGLVSDPALDGGGLHQAGRGGFLNLHADFTPARWYVTLFYVLAVLAVGIHVRHGLWSGLQTLGWSNQARQRRLKGFSTIFAVVLTAGFLSVPLAVTFGLV